MKKFLLFLAAALATALSLQAEAEPDVEPAVATAGIRLDVAQLDQLLGPIALYPDALIALILPASTFPSEIVLAARYLRDGGDPNQIDQQPWDDSVRALVRYPEVVKWLDENLAWTKQLGEAFLGQEADVMNAVQRLRLKARSVGSLVDTPQQQVVVDQSAITIVPAQPDVIYVPYYDPDVVYISRPTYYTSPFFSFSPAYASGFWLSYNFDWSRRKLWCVDRPHRETHWRQHQHHWHRPSYVSHTRGHVRPVDCHDWTPRRSIPSRSHFSHRASVRPAIARPSSHAGSTHGRYQRDTQRSGSDRRWEHNYDRPRNATGERFPTQPRSYTRSRSTGTAPAAPLANPLPHSFSSPLPEAPAAAPTVRGNGSYGTNRARITPGDRSDGNRRGGSRERTGTENSGREHRVPGMRVVAPSTGTAPSAPVATVAPAPSNRSRHFSGQTYTRSGPSLTVAPATSAPVSAPVATSAPSAPRTRSFDRSNHTPTVAPTTSAETRQESAPRSWQGRGSGNHGAGARRQVER